MLKNQAMIDKLKLKDKASLLSGKNTWETYAVEGVFPSIFLADGPHGLRKQLGASDHLGLNKSEQSTCFPTAATLANSWDEELLEEVGVTLGKEAAALDVQVVLGPGLNIKRNPLCGRNFEYYSEDPILAGKLAAASIRGIQKNGTIACPKHFAVNSQEYRRMASDSIVDERTLREIYTTGFEIAVKEGQAKSIMSSYNLINGTYANEHHHLLREILVDEWGFEGFVVSDWGGDNDHTQGVKNGSHLAMPSPGANGPKEIIEAVQTGKLSESILDERVDELLSVILDSTAAKEKSSEIDWQAHHLVAKNAAMKSVVLLKNEKNVLPLSANKKVAVIGDFAQTPRYQGAGSSMVNPHELEATTTVIKNYPIDYNGYAQGFKRGEAANQELVAEAVALANKSDIVLVYAGLDEIFESEGMDRSHIQMPSSQVKLIEKLSETRAEVVVVLSAGSVVDMSWAEKVSGIVHGYLSGQAGASAMLEVLCGQYNPSGKLAETYPYSYQDVPLGLEFPAKGKYAYYKEGVFVGYRYYNSANIPVRYPFGYGLSYTTFEYSHLKVTEKGVQLKIKNIGNLAGEEVVQFYVGKEQSSLLRPAQELKGFKKVFLEAGESKEVQFDFDDKTFRFYQVETSTWEVEGGNYKIEVGSHSRDIRVSGTIEKAGLTIPSSQAQHVPAPYQNLAFEQVTLEDFEYLYGTNVPKESAGIQVLHPNSVISELKTAKNPLARLVYRIIHHLLQKSEQKGQPNLNLLFIYNMPFRAIAKMTNGMVSMEMVDEIVAIVNGQFFRGTGRLCKKFFENRKLEKAMRSEE